MGGEELRQTIIIETSQRLKIGVGLEIINRFAVEDFLSTVRPFTCNSSATAREDCKSSWVILTCLWHMKERIAYKFLNLMPSSRSEDGCV